MMKFTRLIALAAFFMAGVAAQADEGFFVEPMPLPDMVRSVSPDQGLVDTGGSAYPLGVKAVAVKFGTSNVERNPEASGEFILYKDGEEAARQAVGETYPDTEDDNVWGFSFPGAWTANGIYRVEVPAGVWLISGEQSPAFELAYEIFHTMSVEPAGGVVESLKDFKILFEGAARVEMSGKDVLLYKNNTLNKWKLQSLVKQQTVMLGIDGDAVTDDGTYSLELPKGLFTVYYEGKPGVEGDTRTVELQSEELLLTYYITSMPKPTIEPAEGKVTDFMSFTLTAPEGFSLWFIDDMGRSGIYQVLDDGTTAAAPLYQLNTRQEGEQAVLTVVDSALMPVEEPVTPAPGRYRLVLSGGMFSGMYGDVQVNSVPYGYDYTVVEEGDDNGDDNVEQIGYCDKPEVIYNLQGIRVTNPQHGIYIKNGKKIII